MKKTISLCLFLLFCGLLSAQTIREKRESLLSADKVVVPLERELREINEMLEERRMRLADLYAKGRELYDESAPKESYLKLIDEIKAVKAEIAEVERLWKREELAALESYDLWQQPEVTLLELIMDYGSHEGIYLVPPEIGTLRVSLSSNMPIPRETWSDCLRLVLEQNGVGVRDLNPYLKELYFLSHDTTRLYGIASDKEALSLFPDGARILFLLNPGSEDPYSLQHLLQKFSNPQTTALEVIRGEVFIVAPVEAIREMLKIQECLQNNQRATSYELVTLSKLDASEIASILESSFPKGYDSGSSGLQVISFQERPSQLFLSGARHEIERALKLIADIELKVEDAKEKVLFWYTAKHTPAAELAKILGQVYQALVEGKAMSPDEVMSVAIRSTSSSGGESVENKAPDLLVNPQKIGARPNSTKELDSAIKTPFIVDPTNGSIIMVVEHAHLGKIRELLRRLDVPKKMVQIEVLLFEKKMSHQNSSGLNLLRLGDLASGKNKLGGGFEKLAGGIMDFMISRAAGPFMPAFDLVYKFLLNQEDIQINASPSVMTMNQTPATIAIVEEISVNMGAEVDKDKKHQTYTRAQYGISIQITPTINFDEEADGVSFVTLDTDITFDTTQKNSNDRPEVTRRHIKNHVRVEDGETVILGGLRRKSSQDSSESIPFLGEIPGIGKLFSSNEMTDSSTEMFVFITPKIVVSPLDAEKVRREELAKRPGDLPEFLAELEKSRAKEKKKLFQGGLQLLFGRKNEVTSYPSVR